MATTIDYKNANIKPQEPKWIPVVAEQDLEEDFRAAIFDSDDSERETIHIAKWGKNGLDLDVYALDGTERAKVIKRSLGPDNKVDMERLYPILVIASARYPQNHKKAGSKIFQDGDIGILNTKNGSILEEISQVAARLSKLTKQDIDEKKDFSEVTQNDAYIKN